MTTPSTKPGAAKALDFRAAKELDVDCGPSPKTPLRERKWVAPIAIPADSYGEPTSERATPWWMLGRDKDLLFDKDHSPGNSSTSTSSTASKSGGRSMWMWAIPGTITVALLMIALYKFMPNSTYAIAIIAAMCSIAPLAIISIVLACQSGDESCGDTPSNSMVRSLYKRWEFVMTPTPNGAKVFNKMFGPDSPLARGMKAASPSRLGNLMPTPKGSMSQATPVTSAAGTPSGEFVLDALPIKGCAARKRK